MLFDLLCMRYSNSDGIDWIVCRIFGTFIPKLLFVTKIAWVASYLAVITELPSQSCQFCLQRPWRAMNHAFCEIPRGLGIC